MNQILLIFNLFRTEENFEMWVETFASPNVYSCIYFFYFAHVFLITIDSMKFYTVRENPFLLASYSK